MCSRAQQGEAVTVASLLFYFLLSFGGGGAQNADPSMEQDSSRKSGVLLTVDTWLWSQYQDGHVPVPLLWGGGKEPMNPQTFCKTSRALQALTSATDNLKS